jgi:hypothetical protein
MNNTDLFLFSRIKEGLVEEIFPSIHRMIRKHVLDNPEKIFDTLKTSWWKNDDILGTINQQVDHASLVPLDNKPFLYADSMTIPIRQQLYIYFQLYTNVIINCSKFSGVEKYSQPFLDSALKKWIELSCFFITLNMLLPFHIHRKHPKTITDDYKEIERLVRDGIQKALSHLTKTFTWEYTFNRFLSLADKSLLPAQQQQNEQKEGQPHSEENKQQVIMMPPPKYEEAKMDEEKKQIQAQLPPYLVLKK